MRRGHPPECLHAAPVAMFGDARRGLIQPTRDAKEEEQEEGGYVHEALPLWGRGMLRQTGAGSISFVQHVPQPDAIRLTHPASTHLPSTPLPAPPRPRSPLPAVQPVCADAGHPVGVPGPARLHLPPPGRTLQQ